MTTDRWVTPPPTTVHPGQASQFAAALAARVGCTTVAPDRPLPQREALIMDVLQ